MVQIISWNDTKELISSDYRRINGAGGIITFVRKLFLDPSFSVTFWLRLGNYFFMRKSLFFAFVFDYFVNQPNKRVAVVDVH